VRTLAFATVELKEAPVACNIEGCWQTSTASRHSSIYISIFVAKWSWEFLNRRLPTNFNQPASILLCKSSSEKKGNRHKQYSDRASQYRTRKHTYRELHFCTTLVENTHKQPWDTTIYHHKQKNKTLNYENLAVKETQRRLNQDKLEQRSTIPKSQNPALQPVLRLATLWIPESNSTTTTWARNLAGLPKFVSATYRINHTGKTTEDTEEDSSCCNTWWGLHDQRRAREKGAGATRPAVHTRLKSRVTQSEMRKESIYRTRESAPCLSQNKGSHKVEPWAQALFQRGVCHTVALHLKVS
jgi:hypothetical protein